MMKGVILFFLVFATTYGQLRNDTNESESRRPGTPKLRGPFRNRWHWRGQGRKNQTVTPRELNDNAAELFQLVFDTFSEVSKGVNASQLARDSLTIKAAADALVEEVSLEEVNDAINKAAVNIDSISATSALFEDIENLSYDVRRIDVGLRLLKNLAEEGNKRNGAGESIDAIVAAISKTANVLNLLIPDFVDTVIYYAETGVLSESPKESSEKVKTDSVNQKRNGSVCVKWNSIGVCVSWGK